MVYYNRQISGMNLGIDGGLNPPLFVFVLVCVLVLVFFISLNLGIDGGLNPAHLFGLHSQPQLDAVLCQRPDTNRNAQCILA